MSVKSDVNFFLCTQKRINYSECLYDVLEYLDKHSESIKYAKLNNQKGYKKIIKALLENVDKFTQEGSDIELTIS